MAVGLNYPWAFNKYGLYFGPHPAEPWMDRWLEFWKKNLVEMADLGLRVVRIFLLCAGENYGKLPERPGPFSPPHPIDPKFLNDLEQMLESVAASGTGIQVVPSLVDFGFFGPTYGNSGSRYAIAHDAGVREAFLSTLLDPFLAVGKRYSAQIYAWEVINEPYWNCSFVSPPIYRGRFNILPRLPLVRSSAMGEFLGAALRRIEAAGFESTVGHRFYADLKRWPAGTRPQFHYYAKRILWFGDPSTIPDYAETGGAFVGEIDAGLGFGKLWPELGGLDRDPQRRVFERLMLLERKGYKLTLLWPEGEWSCPADPSKWDEELADPLKLSEEARAGIKRFTSGPRGGLASPQGPSAR
jgi:hypothetical protein